MTTWSTFAQLYYDGAYNGVTNDVRTNPGVALERGVSDDLDLKPGTCTFRLGDDTDRYRPSNAASALYGQTGAYMRGAFATGSSVRFTGDAQSMTPGQTDDMQESGGTVVKGDRWVDVKLAGPLGRVGRWRDPLSSPLYTQISGAYATNSAGYWPLEDGRDSTQLANVTNARKPGNAGNGLKLAAADGPAGSDNVVEMTASSQMSFRYGPMSSTAGWQLAWANEIVAADATSRTVFSWRTSNGYTWSWTVNNAGSYGLTVLDGNGTSKLSGSYSYSGTDAPPGQWVYHRIKVHASGGTVTVEASWYGEAAENFWGITDTFSGTVGALLTGEVIGNAATDGAHYAHHFAVAGNTDDLESGDFTDAFNGYRTETAAARFARLCSSRGLPYVIRGTSSLTAPMGAQPIATFQDQLKEIRTSEGGLIFDRGDNIGVIFATRDYLYDQAAAPVLELTYPDDIGPGLAEVTDAVDRYNLVTAKNRNGSTATAELTTGRQGTQNPPTGSGRLDKTVEVNLADDSPLADVANWWLRFYTQPGPRFDTVVVDVDAHPELLTACHAAEPGTFMTITGRTPDPLLLLVLSTAQKTHRSRNVFTFKVFAGAIFRVAQEDDAASLLDSETTELAEDITLSETLWDITTVELEDTWATAGGYDWDANGERVTVSSVTAPAGSIGAYTQTATVVRGVNGVQKTHSTGEEIHLADPVHEG